MALREWKRSESGRVAVSIQNLLGGISQASSNAGVSSAVVNLLVPLEFEVYVAKPQGHAGDLRYVLTVHHKGAGTMWQHPRSFDEYEKFQKQTLEALHHGHWCSGGCPWLESFIGAAFETTKRSISAALSTVVERRRKTVLNVMQSFQHFLINRANHSCAHTLHAVARLYLEFIYGGVIDSAHVMDEFLNAAITAPARKTHEDVMKESKTAKKAQRRLRAQSTSALLAAKKPVATHSAASLTSTNAAALRKTVVGTTGRPEPCAICEDFMPVKDVYIVRLPCGHRFHDECAMPKLNQKLQCPTCHLALAEIA